MSNSPLARGTRASELVITACMDVLTTFALQIGQVTFLVTEFDWVVRSSAAAGAAEDRSSLLPHGCVSVVTTL